MEIYFRRGINYTISNLAEAFFGRRPPMYRKNCPKCHRPSYSSSEIGEWLCPVCGNDLTLFPFFDAFTFEQLPVKVVPFKRKMESYKGRAVK